ncbi:MAG: M48 family metallopeptidase [Leptospira sp.]|nr:M48 family metallopeptidase [Leptospira sp.]
MKGSSRKNEILAFKPGEVMPLFGLEVPIVVNEKARNRERAILTKTCVQVYIEPSKSANNAREKIQIHTEKLLKTLLVDMLSHRIKKYAEMGGFTFNHFRVKKMRTRWGSCSSLGNLNFNIGLALVPVPILDYVVVHELCHLKVPNHSAKFWNTVQKIMPDYKIHRDWLRSHEKEILDYFYKEEGRARVTPLSQKWKQ